MVSVPHSAAMSGGSRPMNPFRDWGNVAQLMRIAFQSEVTSASLPIIPDWPWLRWFTPFIGAFEWLGMDTPEQMFGYVWEETGHIVGNVTIGLGDGRAGVWLLSNVAAHPAYRRRGIARALVELAIKETRRRGGQYLTLQVQSDNIGARTLYEQVGFHSLERISEFSGVNIQYPVSAPGNVRFATPTREQWSEVQSLVTRHLPPPLYTYRYAQAGLFQFAYRRNWLGALADLLAGVRHTHWVVLRGGTLLGGVAMQAQLSWGAHRIGAYFVPEAYGQVEELLMAHIAQQIQHFASRRFTFFFPSAHQPLAECLRQFGVRETRTLDLMALAL